MRKFFFLLFALTLSMANIQAQSVTSHYYLDPERYVLYNITGEDNVMFVLDSQTGIIKVIFAHVMGSDMIKFFINAADLTNKTPTKNGRFRIIVDKDAVKNNVYRMIDSADGRVWSFRLKLKPEKCEFIMLNEAMK